MVKGEINGSVNGIMHASIDGDTELHLISGEITEECDTEEVVGEEIENEKK